MFTVVSVAPLNDPRLEVVAASQTNAANLPVRK
jgi:hypothetical protein